MIEVKVKPYCENCKNFDTEIICKAYDKMQPQKSVCLDGNPYQKRNGKRRIIMLGFIVGAILGAFAGVAMMCLFVAVSDKNDREENSNDN